MTGYRGRRGQLRPAAVAAALAAALLIPAIALAHPLGNFTINHFAGLRVSSTAVALDVVIDRAEIPALQERQRLDRDGDGTVSAAEAESERLLACPELASSLQLSVGGAPVALRPVAAGLAFPPGAGGLATMRLVCEYVGEPAAPISAGTHIEFRDDSFAERIGWREIVFDEGDGGSAHGLGVSARLTAYPDGLLAQPLDMRAVSFAVEAVSDDLGGWTAPDAQALAGGGQGGGVTETPSGTAGGVDLIAAVPGGIGTELASIVGARDLTPIVILGSILIALGLGAAHALSPGHGKTIMAAYLVGTRGSARHAVGLGLAVTVSHTLGVFALAAITLLAANVLPPERLYPILGLVSGALVVAIGGSLLLSRIRAWRDARGAAHGHEHDHEHGHEQDHHAHDHAHGHDHDHTDASAVHSHGGRAHRHALPAGTALSWKALFALGLSGGLVPSASALILLLGSVASGRVGYGLVLVLAFGIGMAIVLGGVGLLLVKASSIVERLPTARRLAGAGGILQVGTAVVVIALGVMLTGQALVQVL